MMRRFFAAIPLLLPLAGCNPYFNHVGEYSAGPVDPFNYPPPYLGAGGDRTKPAKGSFTEVRAYAGGMAIGYYAFPFAPSLSSGKPAPDPLRVLEGTAAYAAFPTPKVYAFDPTDTEPVPARTGCVAPQGYVYDGVRDEVRYDDQGNIFTVLPTATYNPGQTPTWSYEPVARMAPVTSRGEACQGPKSEKHLSLLGDVVSLGLPDRFVLWPLIDTGAPVYRVGESINNSNGVTVQKYGWYNQYLVAYLDGGYIPTVDAMDGDKPITRMTTQKLYYPRSMVMGATGAASGNIGQGYDVVELRRGQADYTPVCAVFTYDAGMAAVTPANLPKDAATIEAMYGPTIKAASTPYIFCLQAE